MDRLRRPGWMALVAAVLYAVSPIDLVPDMLTGVGLIDDLGVFGLALLAFRAWRADGDTRSVAFRALVVAAIYAISPVDLVPDVVPWLSRIDDLIVAAIAIGVAARERKPELEVKP